MCNSDRIAVLLAAYNGEKYIIKQMQTIMEQKHVSVDVFVSLDCSSDQTLQFLMDLKQTYANLYLLDHNKQFGSAGQNFFYLLMEVDFSGYDYVAFADQDDIWLDTKLSCAVNEIQANKVEGYSSNVIAFWECGAEKIINKSSPQVEFDYLFESAGPGCTFVMSNALASAIKSFLLERRETVKSIWLHDWFCYAFARSKGFAWYIDSNSYMLYRQHSANSVGANSGFQSLVKRAKSVISGDVFDKVVTQAHFLGMENLKPLELIEKNTFFSLIKLLTFSSRCRRNVKEKVIFFNAILISSLVKLFR